MFTVETSFLLVLPLLSQSAVQGGDWGVNYPLQELCALKGSSVVIPCTYDYPKSFEGTVLTVETVKWFRSSSPGIADRDTYVYHSTGVNAGVSLSITEPKVTLDPPVPDHTVKEGAFVSLTCGFDRCTLNESSFVCGIKSEEFNLIVNYSPKNTSASVRAPGGIAEGSSVTLTCTSNANPPVSSYTWFRRDGNGDEEKAHQQHLNFSSITSSDSGDYYCEANNSLGAQNSSSVHLSVTGRYREETGIEDLKQHLNN
ncbi:UNVERIFIED_CONTAM: hypothetical protein FKN15_030710 [Acipenser sinensis]